MLMSVLGRDVEFAGSAEDGYFQTLNHVIAGEERLAGLIAPLPQNPVIFDIGGNIGVTAISMAIARPDAKIYVFEPSPSLVGFLRQNTEPFANIEVVNVALSDRASSLHFHQAVYAAGSHVVDDHQLGSADTVEVEAMSLDAYAAATGLVPSFIKIDVEGHEPEVLAGASGVVAAANPLICMEFNSWTLIACGNHNPAAFAKALWENFEVQDQPEPWAFLHNNMVQNGCITDVVMRLKSGRVPSLVEMSVPQKGINLIRAV
jgi:FkbM family methyltransferase